MGLKDRVLNFIAARFGPTMDHPGSGGMAGDAAPDESDGGDDGENGTPDEEDP